MTIDRTMDISAEIKEVIKEIVNKEFEMDQALLMTHLIDSMDVIAIAVTMEKKFGISVDGEEINFDNFDTVGKMSAFVSRKVAERKGE